MLFFWCCLLEGIIHRKEKQNRNTWNLKSFPEDRKSLEESSVQQVYKLKGNIDATRMNCRYISFLNYFFIYEVGLRLTASAHISKVKNKTTTRTPPCSSTSVTNNPAGIRGDCAALWCLDYLTEIYHIPHGCNGHGAFHQLI